MGDTTAPGDDACPATWCAGEEWCAVTCAASVLENKWHPVIVYRLLGEGPLRFNDLAAGIDGITNKMLSESLEALETERLVTREVVAEKPVAVEYSLTERGAALRPVVEALEEWGQTHLRATGAGDDPEA